uniref:C2H2-type domain-containing protein n=1 Tax=Cricetulus griseus TaxID=10029 RepID=A0A8C2LKD8_CRIGR
MNILKKRKRKSLHSSRYSDSSGISRITDGISWIFSDHCYSVCSMRQPDLKYFDNKDDDSETSNDLPKFTDGSKGRHRNQNYLVPSPVLRILDHTVFSTDKSADVEICDEKCDSPESVHPQTQEESPIEVRTSEDVPIAVEVHAISKDYDIKTENNSSESLQDQTDEEPPAKLCKILDKSQALNVTAQQEWPLLRANSSGLYKCELCEFNMIFENLSQHFADTHFSDHLYWCEQCDVQFSSSSELCLQFQEHSLDEQYLCQFCEHEPGDPEDLHSHVVNDSGGHGQCSLLRKATSDKCKNFFVCQVCGFQSRLHTNVNRHVAIEHTKIFPQVCDDCGKGFSSMLEYCKHVNSYLSEGIYLCQYCEYSTGQFEDLKIHLDYKHSADLPHKCSDCLMRFGNEREFHLPVHKTT